MPAESLKIESGFARRFELFRRSPSDYFASVTGTPVADLECPSTGSKTSDSRSESWVPRSARHDQVHQGDSAYRRGPSDAFRDDVGRVEVTRGSRQS